jgi:hypothetical protein
MSNDLTYRCVSYPHFEPDHTWLRKMLLFVDEIHRIVPSSHKLKDSRELLALNDLTGEAVKVCSPEPYIILSQTQAGYFSAALDRLLANAGGRVAKPRITVGARGIKHILGWERLHVDKMNGTTRQLLQERGLLFRSQDEYWYYVPKEVGNLVVGMLANSAAEHQGFDAVTDQPLAYALSNLSQLGPSGTPTVEGAIASAVASVHVPGGIAKLSTKEYVELRKRHNEVRAEYAKMVRELKNVQRISPQLDSVELRIRLDNIVEHLGSEVTRFRKSKAAAKYNDWVPFTLSSLVPIAVTLAFGPSFGVTTGLIAYGVNVTGKITNKSDRFDYPGVLQTFCAADDKAAKAELRALTK